MDKGEISIEDIIVKPENHYPDWKKWIELLEEDPNKTGGWQKAQEGPLLSNRSGKAQTSPSNS